MAERLNAAVLKTVRPRERSPGFESRPFRLWGQILAIGGRLAGYARSSRAEVSTAAGVQEAAGPGKSLAHELAHGGAREQSDPKADVAAQPAPASSTHASPHRNEGRDFLEVDPGCQGAMEPGLRHPRHRRARRQRGPR